MRKSLINTLAFICIAVAGISFASCSELEGMDDANAYYSYRHTATTSTIRKRPVPSTQPLGSPSAWNPFWAVTTTRSSRPATSATRS